MVDTPISIESAEAARAESGNGSGSVPAADLISETFRRLSRVRKARGFHPRGLLFEGDLHTAAAGVLGPKQARHPVTARFSKAVGTPGAVPDVLGFALRVHDPDHPWDLTLVSAGTTPLGRLILRPAVSWGDVNFSSLAPYRTAAGLRWFTAAFVEQGHWTKPAPVNLGRLLNQAPIEMELATAPLAGSPRLAARIRLTAPRSDAPDTAFDPMEFRPPRMRLYPDWLTTVREVAYHGSRVGRRRH